MCMGFLQMEARILRVKLHQTLILIISVALNKGAWRQRKDYFNINSVILRPQRRKNLKSAIQEVINSVNKLSCLPKQEDKECFLCLKFNTVVESQQHPEFSFEYATDRGMTTNWFISHIASCLFDESYNIAATAESWPTELFISFCFVSALKHTVLNQCSKAQSSPDTVAA